MDAIHVSSGNTFPHPTNPPGGWPVEQAARWYDSMLSQGIYTRWVYFLLTNPVARPLFRWWWTHRRGPVIEGINLRKRPEDQAGRRRPAGALHRAASRTPP